VQIKVDPTEMNSDDRQLGLNIKSGINGLAQRCHPDK
jgi:hypothetical protein